MEPWLTVLRLDHAEPLDVEIYDNPVDAETFFHNPVVAGCHQQLSYGSRGTIFARGDDPQCLHIRHGALLIVETMVNTSLKIFKSTG